MSPAPHSPVPPRPARWLTSGRAVLRLFRVGPACVLSRQIVPICPIISPHCHTKWHGEGVRCPAATSKQASRQRGEGGAVPKNSFVYRPTRCNFRVPVCALALPRAGRASECERPITQLSPGGMLARRHGTALRHPAAVSMPSYIIALTAKCPRGRNKPTGG